MGHRGFLGKAKSKFGGTGVVNRAVIKIKLTAVMLWDFLSGPASSMIFI